MMKLWRARNQLTKEPKKRETYYSAKVSVLDNALFVTGFSVRDKGDAISRAVRMLLERKGCSFDRIKITEYALFEREELGSTGIGRGVALPHCKVEYVREPWVGWFIVNPPVEFDSLDGEPVNIIVLLVSPTQPGPHLKCLARVSRLLKDKSFRAALKNAKSDAELKNRIKEEDSRRS